MAHPLTASTIRDAGRPVTRLIFVAASLIGTFSGAGAAAQDTDLVLHYRFDDASGPTARDAAGSNDGVISGATWTTEGRSGGALVFDGDRDCVVSDTYPLDPATTDFSASAWFRPARTVDSYWGIVTQTNESGPGRFWINTSGRGRIRTKIGNPDDAPVIQGDTPLEGDTWYHAVVTYSGGGDIRIYLQGELEASGFDPAESTLGNTVIGCHKSLETSFFNGIIDDVQIYTRALTPAEVSFLYANPGDTLGGPVAVSDAGSASDAGSDVGSDGACFRASCPGPDGGVSSDAGPRDGVGADAGADEMMMTPGGCSIGGPVQQPVPSGAVLWLLAGVLLAFRRRGASFAPRA